MRPFRVRFLTIALIAVVVTCLAVSTWFFWPQPYSSVLRADRLTLREGLPHPFYEAQVYQDELRIKPTVQLSGFPFYRESLALKDEDAVSLRSLLGSWNSFGSHSGEKRCGGFHPDFAAEWSSDGSLYRCLICFGCSEVRIEGPPGAWSSYDLRTEDLVKLLGKYRKNRPAHEYFGLGPLAVTFGLSDRFTVDR